MTLEQRRYRVLLVSGGTRFIKEISTVLLTGNFHKDSAQSGAEARRKLLEDSYDFVVVNAPLPDEFGTRLCTDASRSGSTVAVLFAASDKYEEVYAKTAPHGVFVIRKPCSGAAASQAFSLLIPARERLRAVGKKADKAESKLDEIRIVNKAKWLLIDREDMTEADAHKHLEKAAMDAGVTKRQAAQMIIDRYL